MTTDTQHGVARKSKRIRLEDGEKVFVGADVHRKTYAIALWSDSRGLIHHWTQPAEPTVLARRLEPIRSQVQRVVYEAGPTGYALVRTLRAAGFAADVIVTSQMLRTTVAGAKSDRLDCRTLAEHACKDLLKPVQVPSEQQERDRQITRLRERLARKLLGTAADQELPAGAWHRAARWVELLERQGNRRLAVSEARRAIAILFGRADRRRTACLQAGREGDARTQEAGDGRTIPGTHPLLAVRPRRGTAYGHDVRDGTDCTGAI